MNAVITKKQKNTILVLGAIAALFGAVSGASGLLLREKYLVFEGQDWDVAAISGFTKGYFGVMSGFILFLLGTVGYGLIFPRISCLVFFYWLLSLCCDTLCIIDTMMVFPFTKENGKFAWEHTDNCTQLFTYPGSNSTSSSSTDLRTSDLEYCQDIKIIAILLIIITSAILTSLLFSSITTIVTSIALYRAKNIANAEETSVQMAPFSTPDDFQPMSFTNTVYHTDGYRK